MATTTPDYPHHAFLPLPSQPMYYDDGFRQVLEDNLFYIRSAQDTQTLPVDPGLAYRFENDFYAFLAFQNAPTHLYWLIMRLSGMYSPDEFRRDTSTYCVPDDILVEKIRARYASTLPPATN